MLAASAALLCVLSSAAPAAADTATLAFLDAAGRDDPVVDVGRTITLTGNTAVPKRVYVKRRATGGAPCAPSASTDSGRELVGGTFLNGEPVNGDFRLSRAVIWPDAGTQMFCIWYAASSVESVTPIAQNIAFRTPTGTISGTVSPVSPLVREQVTLTVTGASEAPKRVYATIRAAGGAPCPAAASSDSGNYLIEGTNVNGSFSLSETFSSTTAGPKLICLWLADSSSDTAPVAGPQPVTYSVTAPPPPPPPPPPPCTVPGVTAGTPLADVLSALTAASCTGGRRTYTASARFRRGTLIKTTPVAGAVLPNGGQVALLLSSGAPCRVPAVRRQMTVAAARSRLRASGCTVGRTVRRRSVRVRRGRVVAFGPRSGSRLSPRARVSIVVSRGRR